MLASSAWTRSTADSPAGRPAVVSRESLASHAWEDGAVGWNTIEVHIARLRAKLVSAGVRVVAVRGVGYRLAEA